MKVKRDKIEDISEPPVPKKSRLSNTAGKVKLWMSSADSVEPFCITPVGQNLLIDDLKKNVSLISEMPNLASLNKRHISFHTHTDCLIPAHLTLNEAIATYENNYQNPFVVKYKSSSSPRMLITTLPTSSSMKVSPPIPSPTPITTTVASTTDVTSLPATSSDVNPTSLTTQSLTGSTIRRLQTSLEGLVHRPTPLQMGTSSGSGVVGAGGGSGVVGTGSGSYMRRTGVRTVDKHSSCRGSGATDTCGRCGKRLVNRRLLCGECYQFTQCGTCTVEGDDGTFLCCECLRNAAGRSGESSTGAGYSSATAIELQHSSSSSSEDEEEDQGSAAYNCEQDTAFYSEYEE